MSAGRHFGNILGIIAGNIAEKAEENFAFEIEFLLKLPDQPSEKSKIPFVNFLSEQNFDFCGKEKIFSIFEIFLTWKFFFQKKSLPAYCRQYAGNIAEMAEGKFAFEIGFLLKFLNQWS